MQTEMKYEKWQGKRGKGWEGSKGEEEGKNKN